MVGTSADPDSVLDGSLGGITRTAGVNRTSVRNGVVRGFGGTGIALGDEARISDVVVRENASDGIVVGSMSRVTDCIAEFNGSTGITGGASTTVSGCHALANGTYGIFVTFNGLVDQNIAEQNNIGIGVVSGSTVSRCLLNANKGDGIVALNYNDVRDNVSRANGTTSIGAGIHATGLGNHIEGNTVAINDYGIDVDVANNVSATQPATTPIISGRSWPGTRSGRRCQPGTSA